MTSRTAPDLAGAEGEVAAWFGHLERYDAPPGLRRRVLEACAATSGDRERADPRWGYVRGGLLRRMPFGAWGLASAAALLLALGAAIAVELASPLPTRGASPEAAALLPSDAAAEVLIREDATLTLFHGVETFDDVGLAPGELLADWGR